MKAEEFIKLVSKCGYGTKALIKDNLKNVARMGFVLAKEVK